MTIPRVAIIGRPNVGKSSLMNLIAGAKVSIVDPTPGVTRDRVSAIVDLSPPEPNGPYKPCEFIDTGGFGVYTAEGGRFDEVGHDLATLTADIEGQIARAVSTADLILLCVDTQQGVTAHDREIARLLREEKLGTTKREAPLKPKKKIAKKTAKKTTGKPRPLTVPIRIVATKVDGPKWETHAYELAGLGFGEPLLVSSKTNYMRRDFLDAVYALLPDPREHDTPADLKMAIIGKRNAGKSTLVNTLAGEPRMIVSEIPGTTRDSVDVRLELDGKTIVAIDTAGLRRKKSFQGPIEWYAYDRLERSVKRANVVLLLIDATTKISQVDEQLGQLIQDSYKPAIVVVNKWDLASKQKNRKGELVTTEDFEKYLRDELRGLAFAPISFMSGKTGLNVKDTIALAHELHEQAGRRVTTGKINRVVREVLDQRGPPNKLGTIPKLYYVAQIKTHPLTIAMVVNKPELFTPNYQRFLVNRLRETLGFDEVPIKLLVPRRRPEDDDKGKKMVELSAEAEEPAFEPLDAAQYFED